MEPASTSRAPWHHSLRAVILVAILFPPAGLVLLWLRPGAETGKKVYGSLAIAALTAVYLYLLFGSATLPPNLEAHYEELERQRAEQRASPDMPPAAQSIGVQNAGGGNRNGAGNSNESRAEPAASAPPKQARNYWTDFRGPARDGRYDESGILTEWPSDGLPLLWKQPVGGGYASFVIAEGLAFTIEQRRHREVVAAYDVETGRELWTHDWNAEFIESMGGDGPRATPTWDAGRLYALGAEGDLRCLEARTGKLVWSKNILSDNGAQNLQWGMSGSPWPPTTSSRERRSGNRSTTGRLTPRPCWSPSRANGRS
jgi:hypothetical protein